MSFIYFSYGMTKSASSFVYQLQEEIIRSSSYTFVEIPFSISGIRGKENYLENITDEIIQLIVEWLPENCVTVIKTHGAPSPLALELISEGKAFASATYRDPRDIAVSLLDHGKKSREKGIQDFASFYHPLDTIDMITNQLEKRFSLWAANNNCLLLNFDSIKNSPNVVVENIIKQMGVSNVDAKKVCDKFDNKKNVIHYNVGKNKRFLDLMTEDEINAFDNVFKDFISFCN